MTYLIAVRNHPYPEIKEIPLNRVKNVPALKARMDRQYETVFFWSPR